MEVTLLLFLYFLTCQGNTAEALEAVVTRQPDWPQVFTGEDMTLRCEVQEHTVDWWYTWFKDEDPIGNSFEMQTLTYERVNSRDSGEYKCIAACKTDNRGAESEPYHISVLDLPDSTVTVVSPLPPFSSGDTVTLSCDIAQTEGWDYKWEKDWSLVPDKTSKHITVSLPHENGQYCCYGQRKGSPSVFSSKSDLVDIFISGDRPIPSPVVSHMITGLCSALLVILVLGLLYLTIKCKGLFICTSQRTNAQLPSPSSDQDMRSTNQNQQQYKEEDAHIYEPISLTDQSPSVSGASVPGTQTVYSILQPEKATSINVPGPETVYTMLKPDLATGPNAHVAYDVTLL